MAIAGTALAQTATPTPATPKKEGKPVTWIPGGHPNEVGPNGPAYENVRKALEALTPEQRKKFQENMIRWMNLSPEEKKALRDREEVRKKFMEQEINAAIQESGLQLEGERREMFAKRYTEGRRTIEEQLRKEMNEKRKPLVHELVSHLRNEFASESVAPTTTPTTIQTASPAPTAKP
ncbi:hypothetical protein CfE428DRAFT_4727 [Chthoniobacter flavus Ellin428]|uniref:Uncharacterized protein n=2 Tax=Chthoniobacter flavus TaxID=191863 RepID=B4D737_9BACT|nr:hypothetical protein CfE428DRAFT_4727 [Chthoniobacter flavus Ellin428]